MEHVSAQCVAFRMPVANLRAKFEVSTFNCSRDMQRVQKF